VHKAVGCVHEGEVRDEGNNRLTFFLRGVPGMVSGGGSCLPTRHIRVGAMGWLACPKRVGDMTVMR